METNEYIERNIKTFIEDADKSKTFGCSYVQRICRIGYKQAQHTIAEMHKRGLVKVYGDYAFKFAPPSTQ